MKPYLYLPKFKKVEFFIDDSEYFNIDKNPDISDEVAACFRRAKETFLYKFERFNVSGSPYWRASNKLYATNIPNDKELVGLYLGLFLNGLLNSSVNGVFIADWLKSLETISLSNAIESAESSVESKSNNAAEEIKSSIASAIDIILSQTDVLPLMGFKQTSDYSNAVDSFINSIDALIRNYKDHGKNASISAISIYLAITIRRFCVLYRNVFSKEPARFVSFTKFVEFNQVVEPTNVLDNFRAYLIDKVTKADLDMQESLYKLDFKNEIVVNKGQVNIDSSYYDKIIDYATRSSWEYSILKTDLLNSFENFRSDIVAKAKESVIIRELGLKDMPILPTQFDVLAFSEAEFTVQLKREEYKSQISWLFSKYDELIKEFAQFVDEYYTNDHLTVLPAVSVRVAQFNGVPGAYNFNFGDISTTDYRLTKMIAIADNLANPDLANQIIRKQIVVSGENTRDAVSFDSVPRQLFMTNVQGQDFYGTNSLSDSQMEAWKRSLLCYDLIQTGVDQYCAKRFSAISTIKPPKNFVGNVGSQTNGVVLKDYVDIYLKDVVRTNGGITFSIERVEASKANPLDLFFAIRPYEVSSQEEIKNIYKKRLELLLQGGAQNMRLKTVKYAQSRDYNFNIHMNYFSLASLAANDEILHLSKSPTPAFYPSGMQGWIDDNVPSFKRSMIAKSAYTRWVKIGRLQEITLPIDIRSINPYIVNLSKSAEGDVIYASSTNGTDQYPQYKIINKPFKKGLDDHFITLVVTVDIYRNYPSLVSTAVITKDAKTEKETLRFAPAIGFAPIDDLVPFNNEYLTFERNGELASFQDFVGDFAACETTQDVEESFVNLLTLCLNSARLGVISWKRCAKRLEELVNFSSKYFGASGSLQLADLQGVFCNKTLAVLLKPVIDSKGSEASIISALKDLKGDSYVKLPHATSSCSVNYFTALEAVLFNRPRLKLNLLATGVSSNNYVSEVVVRDSGIIQSMIDICVNKKVQELTLLS